MDIKKETEEMVTITLKEYNDLLRDSDELQALEACGVDNWEGYSERWQYMNNEEEN